MNTQQIIPGEYGGGPDRGPVITTGATRPPVRDDEHAIRPANAAALVAAGLFSVIIFPVTALRLLRSGAEGPPGTARLMAGGLPGGARGDQAGLVGEDHELRPVAGAEPSMNTGTFGVAPQDAGVASATLNTGQQIVGSVGTSLIRAPPRVRIRDGRQPAPDTTKVGSRREAVNDAATGIYRTSLRQGL